MAPLGEGFDDRGGRDGHHPPSSTFCVTEMSIVWLIAGALGLSAVLWLAILAVI